MREECLFKQTVAADGRAICRVRPYWIKAAALRATAPGRVRGGLRPGGRSRRNAPGRLGIDSPLQRINFSAQ